MAITRRELLGLGAAALAARPTFAQEPPPALDPPEAYFTPQEKFRDVSRGKPLPHQLSPEKRADVGLTRETWKLEVMADPDNPPKLGKPLTKGAGTALNWEGLLRLGERKAVKIPKIMTCNNIGRPLGMGLWEGVPLREILWMTDPKEDLRRIFYYGYHNDDPKQIFRSSLPVARVLEDPPGMPPVIVCYKLNGEFLTPERGAPVRMVVPEAYGFKSVKWLTHVVLTNLAVANDTYMEGNNDIDSPLKTFARTLSLKKDAKAGQPVRVWGVAQVGISGLSKVQVSVVPSDPKWPEDDPYFAKAPWKDAELQPPPRAWDGTPARWPMPFTKAHWTAELPGMPEGTYTFRCRSIDGNGIAQPMPRPFQKSGQTQIEEATLTVRA
jgi:DMSO/TMAO reductase YedYZ molybdopterin-dependent catalytic subunit